MSANHWVHEGEVWRNVKTGQTLVPIRGGGAPAWTQHAFRYRYDDGTEATATWMYAQDTNGNVDSTIKFRIRLRIDEYNDKTATILTPNLYYNYQSGGWNPVTTSSSYIRNVASDYTFTDDALVTTERLGSPFPATGAFEGTGRLDTNGTTSSAGITTKNDYMEFEFCLQIQDGDVSNGATLQLRFYDGSTTLDAYGSEISITVQKSAAPTLVIAPLQGNTTVQFITGMTKETDLEVDPLSQSNLVEKFDLVQEFHLHVSDLAQSNLVEFVTGITQQSEIAPQNLSQASLLSTPRVYQTVGQVFIVDLEEGDILDFEAGTAGSATGAAAMIGEYGWSLPLVPPTSYNGMRDDNLKTSVVNLRFYFNPNDVANTVATDDTAIAGLASATSYFGYINLVTHTDNTVYIYSTARDDLSSDHNTSLYQIQREKTLIEVRWTRATDEISADGTCTLWIDNVLKETITDIDNYDLFDNYDDLNIGAWTFDANLTGTLYFDDIILRDDGQYIGPSLDVKNLYQTSKLVADYKSKVRGLYKGNLKGYWPLNETAGSNALDISGRGHNGVYSNVALDDDIAPDGGPAGRWTPASLSTINLFNSGLVKDMDGDKGTVAIWVKIPSAAWTDAALRYAFDLTQYAPATNRISLAKSSASNWLYAFRYANGTDKNVYWTGGGTLNWVHMVFTWDYAADELYLYIDGSYIDGPQADNLQWNGVNLTFNGIGSFNPPSPSYVWDGWISHVSVYNEVLPVAIIQQLADPTSGLLILEQNIDLTVNDLSQSNLVEHVSTTKESTLDVYDLSQANAVPKLSLATITELVVDNLSQSSAVDHITTTKESTLQAYNLSQANTLDKLYIQIGEVFHKTFEGGTTSEWNNVIDPDNDIVVDNGSALVGNYGASFLIDDVNQVALREYLTAISSGVISYRFYLDPNSLTMGDGNDFAVSWLYGDGGYLCYMWLGYTTANGYSIRIGIVDDIPTTHYATTQLISDNQHFIEIKLTRASTSISSDGSLDIWIDGDFKETVDLIDNYDRFANLTYAMVGALASVDYPGTQGTFLVDDFILRDDGQYIGGTYFLQVNDLSQVSTVEKVTLSTEGALAPKTLTQANTVEKVSLTQVHNLSVDDLSQSSTVDRAVIGVDLTIADLSQTSKVSIAYWIQGLLYFVDHEEGDFSDYAGHSSDPDLQVNTNSALVGAYGLERILGTQINIYCSLNKGGSKYQYPQAISIRFYIDPNDAGVSADSQGVVIGLSRDGWYFARVVLEGIFSSGNRQIFGRIAHDTGYTDSLKKVITGKTCVEVLWTRATNSTSSDAQMKVWIDGELWDTVSGIDNYDTFDKLYNITVSGWGFSDTYWSGSFYTDDIIVRDDGQYIGPAAVLSVANLAQASAVEKPTFTTQATLTIKDLSVNTTLDVVTLVQIHNIEVYSISQSSLVEHLELSELAYLTVGDLSVLNTIEKVSLTQLHVLSVDNLSQANTVEEVILSQVHVLNIHDLSQTNSVPLLSVSSEAYMSPFSLSQQSLIETVSLTQQHVLAVDDLSQLTSVETIALIPVPKLEVYDLAGVSTADYAGITTTYNLLPYDLAQANAVSYAVWGDVLTIRNLYIESTLWNSSFWHEQFEFTVTIDRYSPAVASIARYLYDDVTIDQSNIVEVSIDRQSEVNEVDL